MSKPALNSLLARQLKKHGFDAESVPTDIREWQNFLDRIVRTYNEMEELRKSSENILEVSLAEMEKIQKDSSERQKNASENYLQVILNSIQQGVWGLDLNGRVNFINQRAVILLGYSSADEIMGQSMHALVHHSYHDGQPFPQKDCPMYDSFRNGVTHHVEDDVLWRKDGTSFPIAYYSSPIIVGGQCVGSVVSFEDLTEHRRLKKDLEVERMVSIRSSKLASLGQMSAGIAHEINNPLAIMTAAMPALYRSIDDPDKMKEKLKIVQKSCDRIAKIVAGLKKFSRTGERTSHTPHFLCDIAKEVLVLTESYSKKYEVPVTVTDRAKTKINCDEVEIEQVLINLINNGIDAVHSLPEKWVKISIFEDDSMVVLQVSDSGTGIPAPIAQKLFEPFFTTKPIGQGTGIGLSITKGILDEHHATISVVEGANTCFELRFPKVGLMQKTA